MDSAGNSTQFKIKTATALKKLMATYCERAGLDFQVSLPAQITDLTFFSQEHPVHL
jgi:hypothetical protein